VSTAALARAACALLTLAPPCLARASVQPPLFVEEGAASGITHRYEGGWEFFVGGGVATLDCNADGRPDLFLAGGAGASGLFVNVSDTGGALRFERMPDAHPALGDVSGAYPLDVDGDGHTDLVVLRVGENVALRGLGACRFERANEDWNFAGGAAWSTAFTARWDPGAAWPTVVVGNYVDRRADGSPWGTCHDNVLMRPGVGRRFAPAEPLAPGYCALSALFSDWNRDGASELRISNDRQYHRGGEEQLWRVPAVGAPSAYVRADGWRKLSIWGMGIASHDVDGDGYPDYFLTSMGDNKLRTLTQGPERPAYADAARTLGMTAHRPYAGGDIAPSTGWHPEFRDVNNDGFVDLFISKGNVEAMPDFARRDPNNLLLGLPAGGFEEAGLAAGIATYARSRGAAVADFNLDGLPDIVVVNRKAPLEVWRNVGAGSAERPVPLGNWLQLKLRQPGANRNAVGAWVELRIGNRTLRREVTVGGGHAGGGAPWIHFGTGTAERARVRVRWPDGEWSDWYRLYTNQFARIARGRDTAELWLAPARVSRTR